MRRQRFNLRVDERAIARLVARAALARMPPATLGAELLAAAILADIGAPPASAFERKIFERLAYCARLLEMILRSNPKALETAAAAARADVESAFRRPEEVDHGAEPRTAAQRADDELVARLVGRGPP
jgi:hypothetical protein